MSHRGLEETFDSSQQARRRFLGCAMLATAGAASVGASPLSGAAPSEDDRDPNEKCQEIIEPMREVKDKVAFITGGSSGIGLGIARAFTDAKMKVVIGYRTKENLVEAMKSLDAAGDRVHAIRVDVTDRADMERAATETVETFGKVHVLINNAGVAGFAPLSKTTNEDWDWILNVNVTGVFNGVQAFLPRIRGHNEGGQIIATSSMAGLVAIEAGPVYSASKFAVVGLMEALRAELTGTRIGVSVFCPGLVRSKIGHSERNRPADLANSGFGGTSKLPASIGEMIQKPEALMNPLEVGQLVLRGMRNNDLYILTHPEYEGRIRDRNDALVASIPRDLHAPEARISLVRLEENHIYKAERNRKLCMEATSRG